MREIPRAITIPGTNKQIYGLFREVLGAPLVVMIHGITGNNNEHMHYNGARVLERAGFSSYRFNLYGDEPDARDLVDCTVETHADDLDLVLRVLKADEPTRPISVIGHSLGAVTILRSVEKAFDCAVLWDPATPLRGNFSERDDFVWDAANNWWLARWGVDFVIGDAMAKSWAAASIEDIADLKVPVKIIAGANGIGETTRPYFDAANEPKSFVNVPDADHCFNFGDTAETLFVETIDWLDKHGR